MRRCSRLERVEQLTTAKAGLHAGHSQRQVAAQLGVARSTLQDWCLPAAVGGEVPAALQAFVQTPDGVRWLQRQVVVAQFVITLLAGAGVRVVCQFLELSGLSAFVGASYGTQQPINAALESAVVAVAEEQRRALAEGMPPRQVTVCEDETFHPEGCWVGLEPVSNFILLEQYAKDRTAATWTQALTAALEGLAVEVIQGTSDEGKGLVSHVQSALGAHHSPDLFHVQHEVVKATSLPLARQVKQAEAAVAQARGQWQAAREAQAAFARQPQPARGRPPAFEARTQATLVALRQAERDQPPALQQQPDARACVRACVNSVRSTILMTCQPDGHSPSSGLRNAWATRGHACIHWPRRLTGRAALASVLRRPSASPPSGWRRSPFSSPPCTPKSRR